MRLLSRRVGIAFVAGALLVGAFFVADPGRVLLLDSYDAIDAHTLRVTTCSAPALTWTRLTRIAERSTEVEITVKSFTLPLPVGSSCEVVEFMVTLEAPIGDREVTDGTHVVPRRFGSGHAELS